MLFIVVPLLAAGLLLLSIAFFAYFKRALIGRGVRFLRNPAVGRSVIAAGFSLMIAAALIAVAMRP